VCIRSQAVSFTPRFSEMETNMRCWLKTVSKGFQKDVSHLAEAVCRKKDLLCASVKNLCVFVVKLPQTIFTTEAQRSHRDTEIGFSRQAPEARCE